MTGNQEAILNILKAFLNNQQNIEIPNSLDWNKFNRLVEINSISGIVGYVFQQAKRIVFP